MTDRSEEHADELYSRLQTPTKRKAPVISKDSNLPPMKRNAQIDKLEEEQEEEQEEELEEELEEEQEEEEEEEEHVYENTSKKAKYQDNQQEYYYQHPQYAAAPAPPPMPPSMPTQDNEAFSNLIMSWYYAGYYTGLYQARQRWIYSPRSLRKRRISECNSSRLYFNVFTSSYFLSAFASLINPSTKLYCSK